MADGVVRRIPLGVATGVMVGVLVLLAASMFLHEDLEEWLGMEEFPRITQPMELNGKWLGMSVTSLNSAQAMNRGVPAQTKGVMVTEIQEQIGWRATQGGVLPGDVIVGVSGDQIRDLADLYDVSRTVNVGNAVELQVVRWGQPITLLLPPAYQAPMAGGPVPMGNVVPMPQANPVQPVAWQRGMGRGVGQGLGRGGFYCPLDGAAVPATAAAAANYRCPTCMGPMAGIP